MLGFAALAQVPLAAIPRRGFHSTAFAAGWQIQHFQPPAPINKPKRALVTKHRTGFRWIKTKP